MTHTAGDHEQLRQALRALCPRWRKLDHDWRYPEEFVQALTEAGYLVSLIQESYAQMYTMGTFLRYEVEVQKQRYLLAIANGTVRLQAFGVTESTTGSVTVHLLTTVVRRGDYCVISGEKVFISRDQHSDMMLLLARTTLLVQVSKPSQGLSIFPVDLRAGISHGITVQAIQILMNHETNAVYIDQLAVRADHLIGEEGQGFRYILDGINAERILIVAKCIGDGDWFIDRATRYATERVVFGRPIGENQQGVQFPIARAYADIRATNLVRHEAARLLDGEELCGEETNIAKFRASAASWEAANVAMQTHGGYGFAEYAIERKFRVTRLYQVAPISTNLILAYVGEHVLGLPRSY